MAKTPEILDARAALEAALNRAVARVADAEKLLRVARADERRLRRELGTLEPSL